MRTREETEKALRGNVARARSRYTSAIDRFTQVLSVPSGLPDPDGLKRIELIANERKLAMHELATAINTWTEFLRTGIEPPAVEEDRVA